MEPKHDVRAYLECCHKEFMSFKGLGSRYMSIMVTIDR